MLFGRIYSQESFHWLFLDEFNDSLEGYKLSRSDPCPLSCKPEPLDVSEWKKVAPKTFVRKYDFYEGFDSKPGPGRPRIYRSEAERKKAYRARIAGKQYIPPSDNSDIFNNDLYDSDVVAVSERPGKGLCLEARSSIRRGEFISAYAGPPALIRYEFLGIEVSKEEADKMRPWQKTHLRSLSKLRTAIDGVRTPRCLQGVASLANSSRLERNLDANSKFVHSPDESVIYLVALTDIEPFTEILTDYSCEKQSEPSSPRGSSGLRKSIDSAEAEAAEALSSLKRKATSIPATGNQPPQKRKRTKT